MLFLLLMIILQGIFLPVFKDGHKAALFMLLMLFSTLICVAISIVVSRVRTKLINLILPLNLVVRGVLVIFVATLIYKGMTCIPNTYSLITSALSLVLFMSETCMFQSGVLSFVAYFALGSIEIIHR
jgi:hypothetical protein